jgi:hypothetical protein
VISHETFIGLITVCGTLARSWNRLDRLRKLFPPVTFSVSLQVGYGGGA